MSTRTSLRPQAVIGTVNNVASGVSGSMSASITSLPTILQGLTVGAYTYSWSGGGTPVGNIIVEISNDYQLSTTGETANPGTWVQIYVTLNGSSVVNQIPLSGNSGNGAVEWTTGAYAIRTRYARTSGSGALTVQITGKVT